MKERDTRGRFKKVKIERELAQTIDRIGVAINEISLSKMSSLFGDELSRKALHLATMKSFLGQATADLEYTVNLTEASRKAKWADIYAKARTNSENRVKDCETIADREVREIERKEIELKGQLSKLKNLRIDVSDIITTIQTRIGVLKAERAESGLNG